MKYFVSKVYSRLLFYYKYVTLFRHFKKLGKGANIHFPYICMVGLERVSIGKNVNILGGGRIEAVTLYERQSFSPNLVIEDNVFINQHFHCTCAESIFIGEGTSITANCGVFDIIHPYEDININPRKTCIKTKPVYIGKDCLIGMNSVILPGTKLGNHCVVGANSTVAGSFLDNSVIVGSPARVIKRFDQEQGIWRKTDPKGNFID